MNATLLMLAAALQLPIPIQWQFDGPTLSNRTYISDLDYLKANTDLAAKIGCPKSAIPGGCVYEDGSFCLVSEAIATGEKTAFDFTLAGRRFCGEHTGVLLWRDGKVVYATPGWRLSP